MHLKSWKEWAEGWECTEEKARVTQRSNDNLHILQAIWSLWSAVPSAVVLVSALLIPLKSSAIVMYIVSHWGSTEKPASEALCQWAMVRPLEFVLPKHGALEVPPNLCSSSKALTNDWRCWDTQALLLQWGQLWSMPLPSVVVRLIFYSCLWFLPFNTHFPTHLRFFLGMIPDKLDTIPHFRVHSSGGVQSKISFKRTAVS